MESKKTEREIIDLNSSQAQNPSNTRAGTAILEMKAPATTVFRAETENHNNRRSQRKKENWKKIDLALFENWWSGKPGNHPGAPECKTPSDFNTEEVIRSGSQELTVSSAPNVPVAHSGSAEILPANEFQPAPNIEAGTVKQTESSFQDLKIRSAPVQNPSNTEDVIKSGSLEITVSSPVNHFGSTEILPAEVSQPAPIIENVTVKETDSSFQYSTLPSVPDAPVKYPNIASPAEEFRPPPNTRKETESGFQELPNSSALNISVEHSASVDVSPAEQFLAPSKINDNTETEKESSSQGSQELTASFKPHLSVEQNAEPDTLPAEENPPIPDVNKNSGRVTESASQCSQELTASSLPKLPVKDSVSANVLPSEEDTETMESKKAERERIDLNSSQAHNPSNTRAGTAILEMKAPATTVFRAETENHNNRRSQRKKERWKKIDLSLFENWWPGKPGNHPGGLESKTPSDFNSEEVIKSGSQELTVSSAPNVPVAHSGSAEILPANEFQPAPNIEAGTVKQTESSFQDLKIRSAPVQNPSNTEDVIKSGSLEITVSSPVNHFGSTEILPVEVSQPAPIIENVTVKETDSSFQYSTLLSVPDAPVKYPNIASPAEEFRPPPNTRKETESGFQELPNSSALNISVEHSASVNVSPAEQFLAPSKINDNTETEKESSSQGSQELTASFKPHISVEQNAEPDTLPAEENPPKPDVNKNSGRVTESASQCSQELTASSLPKLPVKDSVSANVLPSEEDTETMESKKTERERIDLNSSQAQNPTNTRAGTAILEMKAPATTVFRAETENHNNRRSQRKKERWKKIDLSLFENWWPGKPGNHPGGLESKTPSDFNSEEVIKSGSQELTVSSAPNVPVAHSVSAEILPANEFQPAPNIEDSTVKQTESSLQDLKIRSAPVQNPSNARAAASVLVMKAPAIIISRAKVPEEPWMATDWVPEDDNIHPSSEELEAGLTFEQLYNIIRQRDGSPPPSPNNRRLSVFKEIYN